MSVIRRLLASVTTLAVVLAAVALVLALLALRPIAVPSRVGSAAGPSGSPEASQPQSSPVCGTVEVSTDAPEPTISNRTRASTAVAIATVVDIGPARWNTPDGSRPAFSTVPPRGAYVYRPVTLNITNLLKGNMPSSAAVRLPGGTADCFTFDFGDAPDLAVDHVYAFFLGASRDANGAADSATLTVNEAWAVEKGAVQTPLEGVLPLPSFSSSVASVGTQ